MTRLLAPKSVKTSPAVLHKALQRKYAYGSGADLSGECEDCRKKRLVGGRGGTGLGRVHRGGGFGGESDVPEQATPVETSPAPVPVDQPAQGAAPAAVCDPDRALTWADFTGTPPQGNYAAKTAYTFPKDSTSNPVKFRAVLDGGNSWVKPKWKNPTTRTDTGAQTLIDTCKSYLTANPNNIWSLNDTPDAQCPASPVPDATIEAAKKEECDSKIGPELDRVAGLESSRLLAHEQLHFSIACVLVKKANASVAAGKSASDIETKLSQTDSTVTANYDTETNHGCKAAEQTTWNNKVANSLPDVKIE
jgi:hypothetical protein